MTKCAIFSCLGLGDGLIAQVLSNNLSLNGYKVTTFHPSLSGLQRWFPELPITRFPSQKDMPKALQEFDRFFIIYEKSIWMQAVLRHCETLYPDKTRVLNPIATPKTDYAYWSHGRFDGRRPFVENLMGFCREILQMPLVTKSNGIVPPANVQLRKAAKRVVIHPTSSRESKNWPKEKYLGLAEELKKRGFIPAFIMSSAEKQAWGEVHHEVPDLEDLDAMARYVAESGYMVGNDSGIGHLASCLGLSTVTLCPRKIQADFWRPAWSRGAVLVPPGWIPNLKGMRLRDKYWKSWIPVSKVLQSFLHLT